MYIHARNLCIFFFSFSITWGRVCFSYNSYYVWRSNIRNSKEFTTAISSFYNSIFDQINFFFSEPFKYLQIIGSVQNSNMFGKQKKTFLTSRRKKNSIAFTITEYERENTMENKRNCTTQMFCFQFVWEWTSNENICRPKWHFNRDFLANTAITLRLNFVQKNETTSAWKEKRPTESQNLR